ncbi:T9SS type A sorting domain-containing protein [candidate division WOR-3 bacterium]|nr:T9SS type A sorting domain-containing protein [candidate division WOR-3 bacterium]
MNKRMFVIFVLIFLGSFIFAQRRDSIVRMSAIATGGVPWDNKPDSVFNYLADRVSMCIIEINDSTLPLLLFKSSGSLMNSNGLCYLDTLIYVNRLGTSFWIGRILLPDSIDFITWYDLPNANLSPEPWGIEVIDTILYVAVGDKGLYIFNVRDPTNPTQITFYDTPVNLTELCIVDSLIYLADCDSMIILNIKNPASPQYIGAVDIPTYCTDVHVVYPYAYATAYASFGVGTDGSIKIIDVSNPATPTIIGSINNIRGDPRAVFVTNDYIYTASMDFWYVKENKGKTRADVEGGIRVAQGTVPDSVIISYDTPGDPREIFVRGNLILVPDSDSLQILHHDKTGIAEYNNKVVPLISKFLVHPNPSRNKVTCEFNFQKASRITLTVYDELGRKVREIYRGPIIPGNVQFFWDVRDQNRNIVPSGEYFLKISTPDGKFSESKKVIYLGGE